MGEFHKVFNDLVDNPKDFEATDPYDRIKFLEAELEAMAGGNEWLMAKCNKAYSELSALREAALVLFNTKDRYHAKRNPRHP